MELHEIHITPRNITKGMDFLRQMKLLNLIRTAGYPNRRPAEGFWKKYDAGEFK